MKTIFAFGVNVHVHFFCIFIFVLCERLTLQETIIHVSQNGPFPFTKYQVRKSMGLLRKESLGPRAERHEAARKVDTHPLRDRLVGLGASTYTGANLALIT
jgi:hypothetical protein